MKGLLRTLTLAVVGALAFGACVYWLARERTAQPGPAVDSLVGGYVTGKDGGGRWAYLELRHDGTFRHAICQVVGQRVIDSDERGGLWRREGGALELIWSDGPVDSATVTAAGVEWERLELGLRGQLYQELVPLDCN